MLILTAMWMVPMAGNNGAFGCSCATPKSTNETYQESDAVFAGKAVDIMSKDHTNTVQFEVRMAWKGISESTVFVRTADSGSMCGYSFERGRDYLVYAYNGSDYLSSGSCGRTQPLETAFSDMAYLGPGYVPQPDAPIIEEEPSGSWLLVLLIGVSAGAVIFIVLRRSGE